MKNKRLLLLGTLLKSTSSLNTLKYSKDSKKKGNLIGEKIGIGILFLLLMAYCIFMCIGYKNMGIGYGIPSIAALLISALALFFTFIKTNGYLFGFKEYDMIMSLPFSIKTIVEDKFLYMYVKSLPWYLSISVAMLIGYGIAEKPALYVYPLWLVLSLMIPLIPMAFASLIGFVIAKIGSGFKKGGKAVQIILIVLIVVFALYSRFFIEAMFREQKTEEVLLSMSAAVDNIGGAYLPIKWFSQAINDLNPVSMLLFVGSAVLVFEIIFTLIAKSYRKLNSALMSHAASKNYKFTAQKKTGILNSIAFKEFKRFTGSVNYFTNVGMGHILALVLAVASLIMGLDKMVAMITQNAPLDVTRVYPAIPLIIYLLVGMMSTTTCSPSLEGKNYWILQSLPIEKSTIYKGKMLFNMYLAVPVTVLGIVLMGISAKVSIIDIILYIIVGVMLCGFSTTFGCVCGVKHMKLSWENEIEVIKQGSAVMIYMFPNMIITMLLIVAVIAFSGTINVRLLLAALAVIAFILTVVSYKWVMALSKKN